MKPSKGEFRHRLLQDESLIASRDVRLARRLASGDRPFIGYAWSADSKAFTECSKQMGLLTGSGARSPECRSPFPRPLWKAFPILFRKRLALPPAREAQGQPGRASAPSSSVVRFAAEAFLAPEVVHIERAGSDQRRCTPSPMTLHSHQAVSMPTNDG